MKIVILDGYVCNPGDLSWDAFKELGNLKVYDRTNKNDRLGRAKEADILIVNKCQLDRELIEQLPQLKLICTLATGYNNVDVEAATKQDIVVCNAVGYSSPSVAQHVFALLLRLLNQVERHNQSVQNNEWAKSIDWSYWKSPIMELAGKKMGIFGYGKIGQAVGKIATAFGIEILVPSRGASKDIHPHVTYVSLDDFFEESDVISLHAPLNEKTKHIINAQHLQQMKPTAYLINTGRGDLVNEKALKTALKKGQIAGAGLDVLSQEPPPENHILLDLPNCVITPHQAWASRECRGRLIDIVAGNVAAFLEGAPRNVVSG